MQPQRQSRPVTSTVVSTGPVSMAAAFAMRDGKDRPVNIVVAKSGNKTKREKKQTNTLQKSVTQFFKIKTLFLLTKFVLNFFAPL